VRVAVLPGDGIGREVMEAAVRVLPASAELVDVDAGAERYLAVGSLIMDQEIELIAGCDGLLFGAVGDPRIPDGVLERGILLKLRRDLDLYVNLRPFPELGLTIVRENTQGLYAGLGERSEDEATEISLNTRGAIERCARFAFEFAGSSRGVVTLVHKTNVLTNAGTLWREVTEAVSREFPEIDVRYEHVDAAAYHLVRDPGRFDVILTDNLFGDILSDVAAGVGGGLERAASANLHPDDATRGHRCVGLFEPVHGSAPDIAGRGLADPSAAIEAARMLLEIVGQKERVR
jgi:3-isopropylmalate dehydrogenase